MAGTGRKPRPRARAFVNTMELEIMMKRLGMSSDDIADRIEKSRVSFNFKRKGAVAFTIEEVIALSNAMSLTLDQVNLIFFDGNLRGGKQGGENLRGGNRAAAAAVPV